MPYIPPLSLLLVPSNTSIAYPERIYPLNGAMLWIPHSVAQFDHTTQVRAIFPSRTCQHIYFNFVGLWRLSSVSVSAESALQQGPWIAITVKGWL
jgi:hypothetical protein